MAELHRNLSKAPQLALARQHRQSFTYRLMQGADNCRHANFSSKSYTQVILVWLSDDVSLAPRPALSDDLDVVHYMAGSKIRGARHLWCMDTLRNSRG